MIPFLFLAFAFLLVGCSLMVILQKNPVTSALWLVLGFVSLAALYLMLHAEFLAMVQVIVYAGAIMVLFLFVIMYLNLKRDVEDGLTYALRRVTGWIVGGLLLATGLALVGGRWGLGPAGEGPANGVWGNTAAIGRELYSRYLFPFELTSVLLLVAMVGAILVARGAAPKGEKGSPE